MTQRVCRAKVAKLSALQVRWQYCRIPEKSTERLLSIFGRAHENRPSRKVGKAISTKNEEKGKIQSLRECLLYCQVVRKKHTKVK